MKFRDYYEVLGVDKKASPDQISKEISPRPSSKR